MNNGYRLKVIDENTPFKETREQANHTIGSIAETAGALSQMQSTLSEGNIPSDKMLVHLGYAASHLSEIIGDISSELELLEIETKID